MNILRNIVCLMSTFAAIAMGFFSAQYSYRTLNPYDQMGIKERLEQKAFNTLCAERYPIEMKIYNTNKELTEELDKGNVYNGILDGMLISIKKDIDNYEKNCK